MSENNKNSFMHESVLLHETVDGALFGNAKSNKKAQKKNKYAKKQNAVDENQVTANTDDATDRLENSIFVDATFGRGGHTRALLAKLPASATVFIVDKDPQAIATAQELASTDARVKIIHDSFANIKANLAKHGITQVDGIMADLGVSSPQLDDGSRGFSFMHEGSIDMRMNNSQGMTAGEWLEEVSEEELANVLFNFGDERYSRRIAKAIKEMEEYSSTLALAETIKQAHPKWEKNKHPATKSFQAIRIFINNELGDIDTLLEDSISLLKPNGNLAVISFHSLEDRRVKQFLQNHSRGKHIGDDELLIAPERAQYFYKPSKAQATPAQIKANPRARSAWLRLATRTDCTRDE